MGPCMGGKLVESNKTELQCLQNVKALSTILAFQFNSTVFLIHLYINEKNILLQAFQVQL